MGYGGYSADIRDDDDLSAETYRMDKKSLAVILLSAVLAALLLTLIFSRLRPGSAQNAQKYLEEKYGCDFYVPADGIAKGSLLSDKKEYTALAVEYDDLRFDVSCNVGLGWRGAEYTDNFNDSLCYREFSQLLDEYGLEIYWKYDGTRKAEERYVKDPPTDEEESAGYFAAVDLSDKESGKRQTDTAAELYGRLADICGELSEIDVSAEYSLPVLVKYGGRTAVVFLDTDERLDRAQAEERIIAAVLSDDEEGV